MNELTGVVKLKNPAKLRGAYTIHDFVLKLADGSEKNCAKFDPFDNNLIGEWVTFRCKPNEYKGKTSYTVQGEMSKVAPQTAQTTTTAPASTAVTAKMETPVAEVNREDAREEAVASVKANIVSAEQIIGELELSKVDVIALADLVGRTISAITIGKQRSR